MSKDHAGEPQGAERSIKRSSCILSNGGIQGRVYPTNQDGGLIGLVILRIDSAGEDEVHVNGEVGVI
jgi:hypothetical protein